MASFEFTTEEQAFRARVRDWLERNVPRTPRPISGPETREFDLAWQRAKQSGGFGGISWPVEYGGSGLTLVEQAIWYEEAAYARAPGVGMLSPALGHAGPTIIARGTEEQKRFHLPKILNGDVVWCQGFSEPNAGSDLANLRTAAAIEGDHLVINGQKIWTSHAQWADYQEMLVRTDASGPRHKGITWLIVDMKTPGITVRPIRTMSGDDHYCEVFYENVRVPLGNVVGEINDGWRVAMGTLTSERNASAARNLGEVVVIADELVELARTRTSADGRPLIEDGDIAQRLATLKAQAAACRSMSYVAISNGMKGMEIGSEVAFTYLYFGELLQRLREAAIDMLGSDSLVLEGEAEKWTRSFLADRMYVIAGGSAEIRRNIIADRILGLPKSN
jgi:alkylation response protein AidB-like acyl-CoA dehydrogenase